MTPILTLFLVMAADCIGGTKFHLAIPSVRYAAVTGYQTTIFKPVLHTFQAPLIQPSLVQPIQTPQAPLVIQHQESVTQIPIAQGPILQQPQQPSPIPPAQTMPQPSSDTVAAQPLPLEKEENLPPPQEVASDPSDTVEIQNPELRSAANFQFYNAPPSAYPIYATA